MKPTKLLYLEDSHLKETTAKVVKVGESGKQNFLVLNQTIFYPQGGGQPSDRGVIKNHNGSFTVNYVAMEESHLIHYGKLTGTLVKDNTVHLELDWPTRYQHMQWHTAGHILDEAVKEVLPEFIGAKGQHGINNQCYIEFQGFIDESYRDTIQSKINAIIAAKEPITTRMVTRDQIKAEKIRLSTLPSNKPLRLLQIGERSPVPDGGTQLTSTGELWPIILTHFEYQEGNTRIHYQSQEPLHHAKPKSLTISPHNTSTLSSVSLQQFTTDLHTLTQKAVNQIANETNRIAYLGKKGLFNDLAKNLTTLPPTDKAQAGKSLNQAKRTITSHFDQAITEDSSPTTWIDITAPGYIDPLGHLHPITQAINEIVDIFTAIGFSRFRYPEVDYDYYAFESLNMPTNHPARDEWETFFIDTPPHPQKGSLVLTPHTSNGQVREMERVKGKPPIRMLNLGKCYRRQQDVTHTAMFHQFEGLVVDQGITIQHLKGTLDYFAKQYYGKNAKSRIRPFMFKFTEPSFEVDFSCTHCNGRGVLTHGDKCRFCKSGWHEVGGAGMVHPNVLKTGGIDPEKYTGFAFGWGVERVYTLKPGLELSDIRPLYSNNLDFLANF